jgi:hypothetical protein
MLRLVLILNLLVVTRLLIKRTSPLRVLARCLILCKIVKVLSHIFKALSHILVQCFFGIRNNNYLFFLFVDYMND